MTTASDWQGRTGEEWARQSLGLDRLLAPATEAGLARLAAAPGERILDIGCGAGRSSLAIARAVGPAGGVTGVDISPALLAVAAERRAAAGLDHIEFVLADAGRHPFEPAGHHAAFSAFGTKFFDQPVAALANIRRAIRPGGRAVMLAWREMRENPWASLAAEAGREVLGPAPEPRPGAPGPFAWATPAQFEPILAQAGFAELLWHESRTRPEIALGDDPDPVARAAALMLRVGPLAARLRDAPPDARAAAGAALAARLADHVEDGAVRLGAAAWIIEARA